MSHCITIKLGIVERIKSLRKIELKSSESFTTGSLIISKYVEREMAQSEIRS